MAMGGNSGSDHAAVFAVSSIPSAFITASVVFSVGPHFC
jgi:hypothetical protein